MYDYVPGKTDWFAAGLPREGEAASVPLAGDAAREVPACHFRQSPAAGISPHDDEDVACVAVNDEGVVLGLVRRDRLRAGLSVAVEEIMEPGPTTVRASEPLADLTKRMREAEVEHILVTDPEGRLIGLLRRGEAERLLRGRSSE